MEKEIIERWLKDNNSTNGSSDYDGSGYGYCYCDSDVYGCLAIVNKMHIFVIDEIQTVCRSIKGNILSGYILNYDLTMEKCYVIKGNGYFAHGKSIKEARSELEEKIYRNMNVDHAIDEFIGKFNYNKKYPVSEFYKWHNYLTGSYKMGRDKFAKEHGIDIENDTMTPEEFMELTENDFGGRVIKELNKKFKK